MSLHFNGSFQLLDKWKTINKLEKVRVVGSQVLKGNVGGCLFSLSRRISRRV